MISSHSDRRESACTAETESSSKALVATSPGRDISHFRERGNDNVAENAKGKERFEEDSARNFDACATCPASNERSTKGEDQKMRLARRVADRAFLTNGTIDFHTISWSKKNNHNECGTS